MKAESDLTALRLKELITHKAQKIIPLPNLVGRFTFDATTGIAEVDSNQKIVFGLPDNIVTFKQVLEAVADKKRDQFLDGVHAKQQCMHTSSIQLKNGNLVKEYYRKIYHPQDYEMRSLQKIIGVTRLAA